MSRIGIIDADLLDRGTRFPNLALMKISGYQKSLGNEVELIESYEGLDYDSYDEIHCSKVFSFSKFDERMLDHKNVFRGGTGFFPDGGPSLPYEVEHSMPFYDLYLPYIEREIEAGNRKRSYYADYLDYSIGFATRGCFRKCEFCVNKKYDCVQFHSHVSEWFDPSRKRIYLWDDNILAYGKWRDVFEELQETKRYFQFRQGLDIRLMTPAKAQVLTSSKYDGDFIFAFDHIGDRPVIEKKLSLWREYCQKETKLYLLCAFDSTDGCDIANTFERIRVLFSFGCLPYIMRFENYVNSRYSGMYIQLARWCNQPNIVKKMSFRQFCEADQLRRKRDGLGSAMRALTLFEHDHPDIAARYFDMRMEDFEYVRAMKERRHG